MTRYPYLSALGKAFDLQDYPALEACTTPHGIAFQADLNEGIPAAMHTCDVWYGEPPWQAGYEKFAKLADRPEQVKPFAAFMRDLSEQISAARQPTFLVTGRHALRHLTPDHVAPLILNGDQAVVAIWRGEPWTQPIDAMDLLVRLASEYETIGDFACGLGRAGRVFAAAGKRFVLSDLNARCVGYIARHAAEWGPE